MRLLRRVTGFLTSEDVDWYDKLVAGYLPRPADQTQALANTPAEDLTGLPFLQPDVLTSSGAAYALAKRANIIRVQAASVIWVTAAPE